MGKVIKMEGRIMTKDELKERLNSAVDVLYEGDIALPKDDVSFFITSLLTVVGRASVGNLMLGLGRKVLLRYFEGGDNGPS